MKIFYSFLILLIPALVQSQSNRGLQEHWVSLFNGKDLSGWDIKIAGHAVNENYLNTFRAADGILAINYEEYESFDDKFGHLYYQQPYSYYKLKFEYRFIGEQLKGGASWNVRNSGVMIHSQSAQSNDIDQHFPVSVEVQLLGGLSDGNDRTTANICTPGTYVEMKNKAVMDHCINSNSKTYHGDQWVGVEVVVLGDSLIQHIVEGDTVITYHNPKIDEIFVNKDNYNWEQASVNDPAGWQKAAHSLLGEGYIALQAESHPIEFKNIKLLNLKGCTDPEALNYKPYYMESDDSCIYRRKKD
jgi:hypothetical protein